MREAASFARPILKHLRKVIHTACPVIEESAQLEIHQMNMRFLCLLFGSVTLFALATARSVVANDEEDADKMMQQAMENAQKEAAKAGIKVPAASKQLREMEKESEQEEKEEKAEAATKKAAVHSPAVTSPLTALPDWIPAIPEFRADPKATKKQEDGVETGSMKGTSTASAEAIADAWHAVTTAKKMSYSRQDSDINGKKSIRVTITDSNGGGGEAELELAGKKVTSIALSYKVAMPPAVQPSP